MVVTGRTSLSGSSRLDGRYTELHLGYLKYTYLSELNCDMIFLGKRIRYKIKIGKKMKIATGYVLFCLYHRGNSENYVSRWCVHVNNIGICCIKDINSGKLHQVN